MRSVLIEGIRMQTAAGTDTHSLSTLLRRALGVEFAGADIQIKDGCSDSRRVMPGSLFVAMPGTKTDGSRFIEDAFNRGAAAAICELDGVDVRPGRVFRVADTPA